MKKSEREFQSKVRALGCICCLREGLGDTPAEIHHMLSGGRRRGEMFVLPLCPSHHRNGLDGRNVMKIVSRDHSQRKFESRHGREDDLLADVMARIGAVEKFR